jgi:hypothetical protein
MPAKPGVAVRVPSSAFRSPHGKGPFAGNFLQDPWTSRLRHPGEAAQGTPRRVSNEVGREDDNVSMMLVSALLIVPAIGAFGRIALAWATSD